MSGGETKEIKYELSPLDPERKTVNCQTMITRLAIEVGGMTAWESKTSFGAPIVVRVKKNQSIEDAIKEQSAAIRISFFHP